MEKRWRQWIDEIIAGHFTEQYFVQLQDRNGVRSRNFMIECKKCGFVERSPNYSCSEKNNNPSEHFKSLGWLVSSSSELHRCAYCRPAPLEQDKVKALTRRFLPNNKAARQVGETLDSIKEKDVAVKPSGVTDDVKQMGRDDRRIITDELDKVYLGSDRGYAAGWSDTSVATSLGVPRAWVEEVRQYLFGEAKTNEEFEKLTLIVDQLGKSLKDNKAAISSLAKSLADAGGAADLIERNLADARKRLEAMK